MMTSCSTTGPMRSALLMRSAPKPKSMRSQVTSPSTRPKSKDDGMHVEFLAVSFMLVRAIVKDPMNKLEDHGMHVKLMGQIPSLVRVGVVNFLKDMLKQLEKKAEEDEDH